MKKRYHIIIIAKVLLLVFLCGCAKEAEDGTTAQISEKETSAPATEKQEFSEEEKETPTLITEKQEFGKECKTVYSAEFKTWVNAGDFIVPDCEGRNWDVLSEDEPLKKELGIASDEDVFIAKTYDYDVCDYVEKEYMTINKNQEVRPYYAIFDKAGELKATYRDEIISSYSDGEIFGYQMKTEFEHGFIDVPCVAVCKNKEEMKEKNIFRFVFLADENCIIWHKAETEEAPKNPDNYTLCLDSGRWDDAQWDFTVTWYCDSMQFQDIPHAEEVAENLRKYMDRQLKEELNDIEREPVPDEEKDAETRLVAAVRQILYQDDAYLTVLGETIYWPTWLSMTDSDIRRWIVSFDLKTGKEVKAEDFFGSNYDVEDLKEAAWSEYEKLTEKVPDKYNKAIFDRYYEVIPADRILYYFRKDGMAFYYWCDELGYKWEYIPAAYHLDENLREESEMDLVVPYETLEKIVEK